MQHPDQLSPHSAREGNELRRADNTVRNPVRQGMESYWGEEDREGQGAGGEGAAEGAEGHVWKDQDKEGEIRKVRMKV